jgi:Na+/melibiose symporter-like transporter
LCFYPAGGNDYLIIPICVLRVRDVRQFDYAVDFVPGCGGCRRVKFGTRNTGSYSGLMTFVRKTTTAVAILITGIVLDLTGFVRPTTDHGTGLVESYAQPASAVWGLRMVVLIPILLFMVVAFIASAKLKLNPRRSSLIQRLITHEQNEEDLSEDDAAELAAIRRELY